MARVSLIVLRSPGIARSSDRIASIGAELAGRGYTFELLDVTDPSDKAPAGPLVLDGRSIVAGKHGLAESAVAGLRAAGGDLLVLLDLSMHYKPKDVLDVVVRLDSGGADLVVASRRRALTGSVARRFLGITDPTSGLVGLTRAAATKADGSLAPVGSRFVLELLARVDGTRADVPVGPVSVDSRAAAYWGDVRQLKRLADYRFGNLSRLFQFCFVGASGMVIDLSFYALFQALFTRTSWLEGMTAPLVGGPLALATAAVLSISIALTWNFTINRRLTFNDARQGSIARQYLRYVLSNLLGIGVSLSLRLLLPSWFGFFRRHRLSAAVVGIVAATGISFSMARWFVFGHKSPPVMDETSSTPKGAFSAVTVGPEVAKPMASTPHREGSPASSR